MAVAAATFMACGQSNQSTSNPSTTKDSGAVAMKGLNIAYVDLDSLEAHYEYFKVKKAELEKRQISIDNELKADARALQNRLNSLQQRANTLTQAEGEAIQRDLMQQQQALEEKRNKLSQQYMQVEATFNDELRRKLDDFLGKFNADKRYGYIFSYRDGGSNILYKDPAFDITAEVIEGLNAENEQNKDKK